MTIDSLIMLSGAFVAVLPFLGFPNSWDSVFFLVVGVFVIALGIIVRRRGQSLIVRRPMRDPHFVEHMPEVARDERHEEI
ncbi:MAG: hypothetical protein WC050_00465 [Candidatus Paceibacterota bacterium]